MNTVTAFTIAARYAAARAALRAGAHELRNEQLKSSEQA
jgi:hypothetical protein